tara:strand:- start:26 stop:226 length:201 start_codon:yes stop_codon:yes gene_type:complete
LKVRLQAQPLTTLVAVVAENTNQAIPEVREVMVVVVPVETELELQELTVSAEAEAVVETATELQVV